uniref:Uncharacterized protein n=1 Tax=Raoultella ornithinolytica TaxID=54291 RepID=A0A7G9A6D2_RAOOR|nr:Hypothetical protein [Raoultella ornithinolytica]UFD96561.1 hypothetical protein [Klebsiella oxytoca]
MLAGFTSISTISSQHCSFSLFIHFILKSLNVYETKRIFISKY